MAITLFVPVKDFIESYWPSDLLELPSLDVLNSIWVEPINVVKNPTFTIQTALLFQTELSVGIPGFDAGKLVLAPSGSFTAFKLEFIFEPTPSFRIVDIPIALRLTSSLMRPARRILSNELGKPDRFESDLTKEFLDITFGAVTLSIDLDGNIDLDGTTSVNLPPCFIGDTGIVVEASQIEVFLDQNNPPPGKAAGWRGVFIPHAALYMPDELAGSVGNLELSNAYIGHGGFSGEVTDTWDPPYSAQFFGMEFRLEKVALAFVQNVPTESEINGAITLPFFDEPVNVEIGINFDGGFAVRLDSDDGLYTFTKDGILQLELEALVFEVESGLFIAKLSGQITPLIGKDEGLDWPSFQVDEFLIDSDGNVRLDGGWLDLREQHSLDFYGFQLEITKLGFGKSDDGGKWIGFSGGLKLVDGIPAGASVEGLRLTWYEDEREPKISFNGVGVEFEVPDVLRFKGAVSYQQLEVEGEPVDRFAGSIKLELISLDMLIDATLVFGTAEGDDERYNFFAIYLAVDLPAGIPLWATGLSLYGMAGLFAMQMEPDKHSDEEWYGVGPTDGWYKRPDIGVTDLTNKWVNKEESLALGAGVTIGTAADNGHTFSGRMIFVLVFPGPILLIEGKANILKERSKLGEEPTFRCLSVLDKRAGTFLMGLDAQYKSGEDGELIDISGSAEAFFNLEHADEWHLYLGEDEPREKRIRAEILSLFEANSYFMLDAQWVSTGAWVGYDAHWEFGPLSVGIEAWIETNATISTKPAHLFGELWLHGSADLDVYGFGVGLSVDAEFNADVFDPFHVLGNFEVGINLPWPLSDIDVDITLEWPSDGPDGIPPPLPLPLKEIAIEHFKVTTSWPLQRGSLLLPNYSTMDGFLQDPDNDPSIIEGEEPPLDLPIVPVDCRPHITFGRTVHDDALIGVNPQPVLPNAQPIGWEWIGDPEKNQGTVRVRYGLQEISLHKYVEGAWELTARKGETANPIDIPELFGSWAPMPQLPAGTVISGTDSPIANVKLWLWSKTPFDYTRHNGNAWDEWFTGHFSSYPCIPTPLGNEICCDFEKVELNKRITSPWICPEHPDLQIIWYDIEKTQNIRTLDEVIDGMSHAFCPSLPFIILKFDAPVESVSITIVSEESVQATGFNLQGDELSKTFGGTPDNPHVVVEANDLSFVYLQGTVGMCLIKICAVGVNAEEMIRREAMTQHLNDEMARWQQEGEVLEPHTTYRLKIVSTVETKDFSHDANFNKLREQNEFTYFRTEGPPGLTAISVPEGHSNPDQFDSGLSDLTRYVRQTIPATVSSEGEKPLLPRPVYRAYDVGAEFNEDYVDLMYRLEKRDLGLYLYDNNNQPVRDAQGRLIILNNNWGVTEELTLSKSESTWVNAVDVSTCATLDSSLIVHDSTLNSVAEGQVLDADTIYEAKFIPMLLHEDFAEFNVGAIIDGPAGTIGRWQVFDQGDNSVPSHWEIGEEGTPSSKFIVQTSNIYGGTLNGHDPVKPGTFLLLADNISLPTDHSEQPLNWSDYRFSVTLRSGDNDAIGFVFRYLDDNNYYLFTMDRERKYRRLVRVIDGIHTILIKDNFVYRIDQNYLFTVEAINSSLRIYMEGALVFDVSDDSIDHGRIGLYCWGNTQARFSDVRVDDFSVTAPVVYRFKFTTSQYANFFHHLHSFQDETWQASLEENQLSNEDLSVILSAKVLPDSESSDTEMRAYNSLIENLFGSTSTVNPTEIQVNRIIRDEKTIAMLLQSPEPIDWKRTRLEVLTTDRNTISPQLPDAVKLTDVSFGTTQPNEEFVTLLLRENINLSGYEIDHYHLPSIISESIDDSVLFIDDFDTKESGVLFQESFGPNALDYYEIIDEGMNLGPSDWRVVDNRIVQTKNIYGGSVTGLVPDKPGTMAVVGSPSWSNVLINVTFGSDDNDAIGVVFRYKDEDNYYRISMDRERSYRRLVKKVDGSFYVLWEDNNAYNQGQSYKLVVYAYDAQILCYIDDTFIFNLLSAHFDFDFPRLFAF